LLQLGYSFSMRARFGCQALVAALIVLVAQGPWSPTLLGDDTTVETVDASAPAGVRSVNADDLSRAGGNDGEIAADSPTTSVPVGPAGPIGAPAAAPDTAPTDAVTPSAADLASPVAVANGPVPTQAPTKAQMPASSGTHLATKGAISPSPGTSSAPRSTTPQSTAPPSGVSSAGWRLTIYYTAVESFHSGATQSVTGCVGQNCSRGNSDLGTYPATFVNAVHDEGTGRITNGPTAGMYLNWSFDVGYWLDTVAASGYGVALRPFLSAAADGGALPKGARFRVVDPLRQNDGSGIEPGFAAQLRNTVWDVEDQFTPGLGGAGHLDLYIGEQDRADFTNSDRYVELVNATIIRIS